MTAVDIQENVWRHGIPVPSTPTRMPHKPVPSVPVMRAPYAPDSSHALRFWLAGPLTLLIFVPALFSGIFGAPVMPVGMALAWLMLRSGKDGYDDFAMGGFKIGFAAFLIAIPFGGATLFAFGLLFGPLMAMTFRAIAGSWQPAPRKAATPHAVSPSATMPDLARVPRTT